MSLKPGRYIIQLAESGRYIGRDLREDRSLRPKQVSLLPPGVEAPIWDVEKAGDGYIIKANGDPTAPVNKRLVALVDGSIAEVWKVRKTFQYENGYIVTTSSGVSGWILKEFGDMAPVLVVPLIELPVNQIFLFYPVEKE